MAQYVAITTTPAKFTHISKRGEKTFKALCKRDPFPERWHVPIKVIKGYCPDCKRRAGL